MSDSMAYAGSGAEVVSEREFPVSRDRLFAAFADPVTLARWWGPRGSSNTFETFDLVEGGAWRFVMRADDGTDYAMEKEFLEVVPPERIVMRHRSPMHDFDMAMTYAVVGEERTRLTWRMTFPSEADVAPIREFLVQANEQNFDRLEGVVGLAGPA